MGASHGVVGVAVNGVGAGHGSGVGVVPLCPTWVPRERCLLADVVVAGLPPAQGSISMTCTGGHIW